jgi:adenine C2-methylase RlmN of 23S rRNA A2503 and tRNA A37
MSEDVKQAAEKIKKQNAMATASAVLPDGSLVEMVYRPEENRTLLCVSKAGGIRYEPTLLTAIGA